MSSAGHPQHAPLAQLTKDNHGPAVVVASSIMIITTAVIVLTRLITRFRLTHRFAADDYLIAISLIFAIGQTTCVILACKYGLGRHIDAIPAPSLLLLNKVEYTSNILQIVTLTAAKTSVIFLILNLCPPRRTQLASYTLLGVIAVWGTSGTVLTAFQCQLPHPWDRTTKCIDLYAVSNYNTALNACTDLALIVMPFSMIWGIQASLYKQWLVISLFGSRIIVVAFAITAAIFFHSPLLRPDSDYTWNLVTPTLWSQAMVNLSLMTACLPCIRRFLADLKTGMMAVRVSEPLEMTMKNSNSYSYSKSSANTSATRTLRKDSATPMTPSQLAKRLSLMAQRRASAGRLEECGDKQNWARDQEQFTGNRRVSARTVIEKSESMKTLTDDRVIVQTIDYEVEFQATSSEYARSQRSESLLASSSPTHGVVEMIHEKH